MSGIARGCGVVQDAVSAIYAGMEQCGAEEVTCNCNVLGGNTFAVNADGFSGVGLGIAPGRQAEIRIDSGDACRWQPKNLLLVAYRASNTVNQLANPIERLPFLLLNAQIGTISMIRRVGDVGFGIVSDGYSDNKDLTCVDWASFIATNNQGLTLTVYNPNDVSVHVFADLWGRALQS